MAVEPSIAPLRSTGLDDLVAREEALFVERQPRSAQLRAGGPGNRWPAG